MPPEVNLLNEKNNGECVLSLINKNLILSSHDISDGGLLISLSEMVLGSGFGAKITKPKKLTNLFRYFFGEDQARYIVEVPIDNVNKVKEVLNQNSVHFDELGIVDGKALTFNNDLKLPIEELKDVNMFWLERYMNN